MSEDTVTVGQCTIRWSPTADSDTREGLLAKMRAIRPSKRRVAAVNYERNRARAQESAEYILSQPDVTDPPKRGVTVRIYYRSQGGEILAFDTAPMTPYAAQRLADHCRQSDVIDYDIFPVGGVRSLRRDARLVVLPSQATDAVQVSCDESLATATSATFNPDPTRPIGSRSYYAEAKARRAQRWQARSAA